MARGQITIYIVIAIVILLVFGYMNSIPSPEPLPKPLERPIVDEQLVRSCIQDAADKVVAQFMTSGDINPVQTVSSSWGRLAVFTNPRTVPSVDEAAHSFSSSLENIVGDCAIQQTDPVTVLATPELIHVETLVSQDSIHFTVSMPVRFESESLSTIESEFVLEVIYPLRQHLEIAHKAASAFNSEGYINLSKLSLSDAEFQLSQEPDGTNLIRQTDPLTDTTYTYAVMPQ